MTISNDIVGNITLLLILFQIKHFVCDWVIQTKEEVKYKGVYLHPVGVLHSLKHALATLIITNYFFSSDIAILFTFIDGISHYHIDWLKQSIGKKLNLSIEDNRFWIAIGLDQMLHQFIYITIIYIAYGLL
jgi:hypothetical protein